MKPSAVNKIAKFACVSALALTSFAAYAEVTVSDAWARATRPAQKVGAAYMTLQSSENTTLVKAESPAAGAVEIHSMTMNDGVMKMRMLESLELPAGEAVKLAPGGYHLMLFDLAKPLQAGETVEFTLHFKDSAGNTSTMKTQAPVRAN
jgi:copper(I)-binding protein